MSLFRIECPGLILFYLQLNQLGLWWNEIDDDGAAMLLGCLSNVKRLNLLNRKVSFEMQTELYERGREEGCEVNCDLT